MIGLAVVLAVTMTMPEPVLVGRGVRVIATVPEAVRGGRGPDARPGPGPGHPHGVEPPSLDGGSTACITPRLVFQPGRGLLPRDSR